MTPELLLKVMPFAGNKVSLYVGPLTSAMGEFGIDTPKRQAAFLAQVCHESGSLKYTREIANGEAYEGRADLGNTVAGDGIKYKGRGLIQITGRVNYEKCGHALGQNFIDDPDSLETPENASRSAAWFWNFKNLSPLADGDKFCAITKLINGGFNGLDDRIAHWLRAREIFEL